MIAAKKPVFELTALGHLIEELHHGILLVKPAAEGILHTGGTAVGNNPSLPCPGWPWRSDIPPCWAVPPSTRTGGSLDTSLPSVQRPAFLLKQKIVRLQGTVLDVVATGPAYGEKSFSTQGKYLSPFQKDHRRADTPDAPASPLLRRIFL